MSDYTSKRALVDSIMKNVLITTEEGFELRGEIVDLIKNLPTLDEKEIIRKPFERVVERLENEKERNDISCTYWDKYDWKDSIQYNEYDMSRKKSECFAEAIEIAKEECGINE